MIFPVAVLVLLLAVAAWLGWPWLQQAMSPAPATVEAPAIEIESATEPQAAQDGTAPAEAAEVAPAGPEHPVEPEPVSEAQVQAHVHNLDDSDPLIREHLATLLSRQDALRFFQLDGLVRRIVATVDNLARPQAPARIWPFNPTPGRFTTATQADGTQTIHSGNSARYEPWVRMIEALDVEKVFRIYRHLYPLFQQAYEELGYPGRYFNDRLVQVLDLLIATPVHDEPLAVTLVEVKGPVPSLRPWVRYEFADPALASLSSGQRILLRMGPDHQRRLQAKMREIRARIA